MNKELKPTKNPIVLNQTRSEDAIKITVTALLILAGTWMALKISKEMLKELEKEKLVTYTKVFLNNIFKII
jgi:hypothetical protein